MGIMDLDLHMIVKDETSSLENLFKSIEKIPFSSIRIGFTGSNSETRNILNKYATHVYDFKWIDHYSKARQFVYDKCKATHVMWLDADDDFIGADKFENLISPYLHNGIGIVFLPYQYDFDLDGNLSISMYRERIVKRTEFYWDGRVHEVLKTYKESVPYLFLDELIVKHNHAINKDSRNDRNLKLAKKAYETDHESRDILSYAMALADTGNNREAFKIMKGYQHGKDHFHCNYFALIFNGNLAMAEGQLDTAMIFYEKAMSEMPQLGEAYFKMAEAYHFKEEFPNKVIEYCEKGFYLDMPHHWLFPFDIRNYTLRPAKLYAHALSMAYDLKKSLAVVTETLKTYKNDPWLQKKRQELLKDLLIEEVLREAPSGRRNT